MKIRIGFVLLLGIFFFGCNEKSEQNTKSSLQKIKVKDTNTSNSIVSISGLKWHLSMEDALQEAKNQKKHMVVMVGEESCRWCKKMKTQTLTDERIQNKLKEYILVSVKRSDSNAIKYLDTFDGNIPSFFFMQDDKELIDSIVGYFKADDFLEYLNEIEE